MFAAALCAVLATRVATGFDHFRAKVVDGRPVFPVHGIARVDVDQRQLNDTLGPPVAIVARIQNDSAGAKAFTIVTDGQAACERTVPGRGATTRVDCAWQGDWNPKGPHRVEVAGAGDNWKLAYLELATHHGATRSYDLIIVPAQSRRYARPTPVGMAVAFLLLSLAFLIPRPLMPPALVRVHKAVCAPVLVLLILVFLSPHVSPFAVLLSKAAFDGAACVLLLPRLWVAAQWARRNTARSGRPVAGCATAAAIVAAVYGTVVVHGLDEDYHGNYSGFVHLSRSRFDHDPMLRDRADVRQSLLLPENVGYDGQFMYLMTFDPFLRRYHDDPSQYDRFIDAPPYRFGRIGFSLLTKLFSLDAWQRYPGTMTWLILGSLFAGALILAVTAHVTGSAPAWGMLVVLVPGFWQSLQNSLPEPLAAALLLGGYLCVLRDRSRWAGLMFAISLLVRETGTILVVAVMAAMLLSGRRREGIALGALSFAPILAWRSYVGWTLWPAWGLQAFWYNPHDFGLPFAGILDLWHAIGRGSYFPGVPDLTRAGVFYPILLVCGSALAAAAAVRKPGAATFAAAMYGLVAVSLTYRQMWVHVENAQRGTYELFVALALVTVHLRSHSRTFRVALDGCWIATAAYVFVGAFDADYIRRGIVAFFF